MTELARAVVRIVSVTLVVSVVTFLLVGVGPDPVSQLRQNPEFTEADVERIIAELGWDRPLHERYLRWLGGLLTGDWGASVVSRRPVLELVAERAPVTIALGIAAELLALCIAVPLGTWTALRRGRRSDRTITIASAVALGMPAFALVIGAQLLLVWLHGLGAPVPAAAGMPMNGDLAGTAAALVVPALVLGVLQGIGWSRVHRVETITALTEPCMSAARARGLPDAHVVRRHALPLTWGMLAMMLAVDLAGLAAGSILVETAFDLPGLGSLLFESVTSGDVPVVLALVVVGAALLVVATTLADVLHRRLDPRVAA